MFGSVTTSTPDPSRAGRKQETVMTGPTYRLAEFLNRNWDEKVGRTNHEVAAEMGLRATNMVSMWRTGKTKVALERLVEISDIMGVDLAILLPLWFEQYLGNTDTGLRRITKFLSRNVTANEFELIEALRKKTRDIDPEFSDKEIKTAVKALTS